MDDPQVDVAREMQPDNVLLWTGFLATPFIWLVQMTAVYSLSLLVCREGSLLPLHAASFCGLAMALIGTAVAAREWRTTREIPAEGPVAPVQSRARFMAIVGLMTGSLFTLIIAAQGLAVFLLNPCPPASNQHAERFQQHTMGVEPSDQNYTLVRARSSLP
jgi:hypothetical protein